MDSTTPLPVEIRRPFSVGGRPCARFTVWLLAAAAVREAAGGVGAAEAAAQLARPGGLPMALSRAFATFAEAGLAVGWGDRRDVAPASLPLRGRGRGPFWLAPSAAARLRFVAGGTAVDAQALAAFVGDASRAADAQLDLAAWHALVGLRQGAEERRYDAEVDAAPLEAGLAELGLAARDRLARRWGLFLAAQQARRRADVPRARRLLAAALDDAAPDPDPRARALAALCRIGLLFCDYQERRLEAVGAGLERFERETADARVNPRLGAEFHNLRALWRRATLDGAGPQPAAALAVLRDLQAALACALEADAFTLLESVASNLGYSLWLLEPHLPADRAGSGNRLEAIRWILLGDWLCQRHGLAGGSAWNLISVCRVARGAGRRPAARAGAGEGAAVPLALDLVRAAAGRHAALLGAPRQVRRWRDLTATLAAAASAPDAGLPPLQRAAAWLEHAWWLAADGLADEASAAAGRVQDLLPTLVPRDRGFFRAELRALRPRGGR